jgi:site-specific DNA-methyltransferase (adenine-specific)
MIWAVIKMVEYVQYNNDIEIDNQENEVKNQSGKAYFEKGIFEKNINNTKYHIKKIRAKNWDYYYLVEHFKEAGRYRTKILTSYGRQKPIFYKPNLVKGSCEEYLKIMPEASVDLIIDDPPYGITKLPWDQVPDWDILAGLYNNVLTENGLVYIFGKQPSLIEVYNSFQRYFDFRFEIIWNRNNIPWSSNFKPLPIHENIFVFCKKGARIDNTKFYTKQVMTAGKPYSKNRKKNHPATQKAFNSIPFSVKKRAKRYPKSILEINPIISNSEYPTQKPSELISWIVRASSLQNDIILDPHMGSGTTMMVALNLCRKSIGIDINQIAQNIAIKRIQDALDKLPEKYVQQSQEIDNKRFLQAVEAI